MSWSLASPNAGVEQVALDATDAAAMQPTVRGADAVIVTVGARAREGETPRTDITRAVVAAMSAEGVRRLVVQSSWGVGDSYDSMPFVMKRLVVQLILKQALADHGMQEAPLVDSGLDWSVLPPGGLTDEPEAAIDFLTDLTRHRGPHPTSSTPGYMRWSRPRRRSCRTWPPRGTGPRPHVPAVAGRPRVRRQSPKGSGSTVTPRQKATRSVIPFAASDGVG